MPFVYLVRFFSDASNFEDVITTWDLYSAAYTDHMGVCITINKNRGEFKKLH